MLYVVFDFTDTRHGKVVINNTTPIWVCQNAMKQNEDCLYCKCNKCYMKDSCNSVNINIESRRSTRCRKKSNEKEGKISTKTQQFATAKTYVECDHDTLICCYESAYFTPDYIAVRQKKNHKLPIVCSICQFEILNKIDEKEMNPKVVAL